MSQPENPFAPPRAEVADIAADGALTLAGRGTRLLAALLDTGVQIIAMAALNLVLPWSLFASNPAPGTMIATGLLSLLVFGLVQGWLLVQRGQTIGKVALGVRIVRPDGSKVSAGRLLGLRYAVGFVIAIVPFVGVIYSLVDSLLIFRASHRCLHDQIADTLVIRV